MCIMKHQPPDWECKYGHSEIVEGVLYLAGEDDVDILLYGSEEAKNINGKGRFLKEPVPQIDVWIDLRDIRDTNRTVFIPEQVEYISIPFHDGKLDEAREHLPHALQALTDRMDKNKRVLVSCHQGRSRSVMLLLWYLSQKERSFMDAYWTIKGKRPIMEPDKNFKPLIEEWKNLYPLEKTGW